MSNPFENIIIVGRQDDPRVQEPLQLLTAHLTKAGVGLLTNEEIARADLIIAIGGDGTILYASRLARESSTPILGINRGRLGFLADVTPDEMIASVDQVLNGNYSTDSRLLLEARLQRSTEKDDVAYALNDVVLQRRETGDVLFFMVRSPPLRDKPKPPALLAVNFVDVTVKLSLAASAYSPPTPVTAQLATVTVLSSQRTP